MFNSGQNSYSHWRWAEFRKWSQNPCGCSVNHQPFELGWKLISIVVESSEEEQEKSLWLLCPAGASKTITERENASLKSLLISPYAAKIDKLFVRVLLEKYESRNSKPEYQSSISQRSINSRLKARAYFIGNCQCLHPLHIVISLQCGQTQSLRFTIRIPRKGVTEKPFLSIFNYEVVLGHVLCANQTRLLDKTHREKFPPRFSSSYFYHFWSLKGMGNCPSFSGNWNAQ